MYRRTQAHRWALTAVLLCVALAPDARAQVITDGTVGAAIALPLSGAGSDTYNVDSSLGTSRGSNLFHSFSRFDVGTGHTATFNAASTIQNIISRVTGGNASTIDGTIRSTAVNADVFLINPSGIVFGANASLDVPHSFTASTADSVKLGNSGSFNASDPSASTLSADAPSAFGFVSAGRDISISGATLNVPAGETISLIGGNVTLTDATVQAERGQVNLIASAGPGNVSVAGADPAISERTVRGTVRVSANTFAATGNVDTSGAGSGRILIRSGNLFVEGGSIKSQNTGTSNGGDIEIDLTGQLVTSGDANIQTSSVNSGDAGAIIIHAADARIGGNTTISSDTQFLGRAGDVSIDAAQLLLNDNARISADAFGAGGGGTVRIDSDDFTFTDFTFISARTAFPGSGPAGSINIAGGAMRASGEATVDVSSFFFSDGDGGSIALDLQSLDMGEEAWIISSTFTDGTGGTIDIRADQIVLGGSSAISTTTFSSGDGGDITVTTDVLSMGGSAVISSGTEGTGSAGSVTIRAGTVNVSGTTTISSESEGINAFVRGVPIPSTTPGGGQGGDVRIEADDFRAQGSVQIATGTGGTGAGGDLTLVATDVAIAEGATVSARSTGSGTAGNIDLEARDTFKLIRAAVTTEANASDGGNIDIKAGELILIRNGRITTSVSDGDGDGGNIFIDPPFVVLNNATIIANANGGAGGNIRIVASSLFSDPDTVIDASSALGIDGTVVIDSPSNDVSGALTVLPSDLLAAERLRIVRCAQRTRSDISTIVMRPRDALPPTSDDLLGASRPSVAGSASGLQASGTPPGTGGGAAAGESAPPRFALATGCGVNSFGTL